MDDIEKQLASLERGINCLRKELEDSKTKISNDITDFKRDIAERFATHKYEVSESVSQSAYKCRAEMAQAISALDLLINQRLDRTKDDLAEKIIDNKAVGRDASDEMKKSLVDMIQAKVRYVTITTTVLMAAMSWVWAYSYRTGERVDVFRDEIRQEISAVKDELKTILLDDVKVSLFKLEARQDQLLEVLDTKATFKQKLGR